MGTGGSDSAVGSEAAPFVTIERGRDALRETGPGTVWLRGGHYDLPATVSFDQRDSGATYASFPGERASLTGGLPLKSEWFTRVGDSPVFSVNLRDHGISDFGSLVPRGWGNVQPAALELFSNGLPMTLARWPNKGQFARTEKAELPRPPFKGRDIFLHGYWQFHWADAHLPLAGSVEPLFGFAADRPYYVYNVLEKLDEPGEYYLDRDTGLLSVWPRGTMAGEYFQVSMQNGPLLNLRSASNVTLRDLTLEVSRGSLLFIEGGEQVRVERCLVRNSGTTAVYLYAHESGLDYCQISGTGGAGVEMGAGHRSTLTRGNASVSNSVIRETGRTYWANSPGVYITSGVGNTLSHNLFEDMPHSAIVFVGNDHLVEGNEIRRVCKISRDSGAIYTGRDWGYRGNVIRGNFIHDVKSSEGPDVQGIYLDDCVSGITVTENVFLRVTGAGVNMGGGRDNLVTKNVFADSGAAQYNDDRGQWQINNIPGDSWNLRERLFAGGIDYQNGVWAAAYPLLAAIPNDWELIQQGSWRNPEGTVFDENVGWGNQQWDTEYTNSIPGALRAYKSNQNNKPNHAPIATPAYGPRDFPRAVRIAR